MSCIFYMVIKNEGRIGETRALLLLISRYGEKLHDRFQNSSIHRRVDVVY